MTDQNCEDVLPGWFSHIPRLAAISDGVWREALATARLHRWRRGTCIRREPRSQTNVMVVLQGHLRVLTHSPSGREVMLYRVGPGEVCLFNIFSRLLGRPVAPAMALAEEDLEVAFVDGARFQDALFKSPELAAHIFDLMACQAEHLVQLIGEISFKRLDARLSELLVELSQEAPVIAITHGDLAARLGSPREVVSRTLKEFEARGWLRRERGKLEILAPEPLRALARGQECSGTYSSPRRSCHDTTHR